MTHSTAPFISLIASGGIRAAGAEPWIYLKTGDGQRCEGTAAEGHCFPTAGTPKPDAAGGWEWWSTLFVGVFSVLHKIDPSLRYVEEGLEMGMDAITTFLPNPHSGCRTDHRHTLA